MRASVSSASAYEPATAAPPPTAAARAPPERPAINLSGRRAPRRQRSVTRRHSRPRLAPPIDAPRAPQDPQRRALHALAGGQAGGRRRAHKQHNQAHLKALIQLSPNPPRPSALFSNIIHPLQSTPHNSPRRRPLPHPFHRRPTQSPGGPRAPSPLAAAATPCAAPRPHGACREAKRNRSDRSGAARAPSARRAAPRLEARQPSRREVPLWLLASRGAPARQNAPRRRADAHQQPSGAHRPPHAPRERA